MTNRLLCTASLLLGPTRLDPGFAVRVPCRTADQPRFPRQLTPWPATPSDRGPSEGQHYAVRRAGRRVAASTTSIDPAAASTSAAPRAGLATRGYDLRQGGAP